jgi:mono/diheme cytochrome c family protein
MAKKILVVAAVITGGLLALALAAGIGLFIVGGSQLARTQAVQVQAIPISTGEETLARGQHLVQVSCMSCHGADLSGKAMMDDPAIGRLYASNITGLGESHSQEDLIRAIRHGVGKDGRQLMIMPSEIFVHLSAEDLGAITAYLMSLPRVGEIHSAPQIAPVGRMLLAAGLFGQVFPAEYIDHHLPYPVMPEIGANEAYGEYIASLCMGCHGPDLGGAQPPDPDSPYAGSLMPAAAWSEDEFIQTLRTGVTPYGLALDPDFMPWESFGKLTDDELKGLWLHLRSLGGR